jgi:hypothetical protein
MSNKVVLASALVAALSLLVQRGVAQDSPPFHRGPWPIHNGFNYQPTQNKLRGLHHQDVRPDEAREIDRLYDPLRSRSEKHSASLSRKRRDRMIASDRAKRSAHASMKAALVEKHKRSRPYQRLKKFPPTWPLMFR